MTDFGDAFAAAGRLILSGDADLMEIVWLSLRVSLTAVALASLIGLPLGAAIAVWRFPGRQIVIALTTAFMALPPVVVGLVVYMMLSRAGPLGPLGLLYTPTAMIIAQTLLVLPIVTALSWRTLAALHEEYDALFRVMRAPRWMAIGALLRDGRFTLLTAVLAGLGRALAEVGAVMIVGGNIDHVTRVMTTAIALETSRGDLALALGLGMILLALSVAISLTATLLAARAERVSGEGPKQGVRDAGRGAAGV